MGIGKQLRERRLALGLTLDKLEEMTGVATGTISALEQRDSKRSQYFPVLAKALGLSYDSLAAGSPPPEPVDMDAHPDLVSVRTVKMTLRAGVNGFSIDGDQSDGPPIFFRSEWLRDRGYKPYNLIALKVQGASMEPMLFQGDMVVINTADTEPKDGKIFAVNYEGEAMIKRIQRDGGSWWLTSDNGDQRRFPRKECIEGACLIVGRVIHRQSEEM